LPRPRSLALVLALGTWLGSAGVAAQDAGPSAADLVRAGAEAERAFEPARAVELYERAVEADPTSRLATRARRRLSYLRARAEGDWAPLAAMLELRARPPAERTRAATSAFEGRVRGFPPGRVRAESWPLVAGAWMDLGEPARAEAAYRAMLEEPELTESERIAAQTGIARALAAQGSAAEGAAHLEEAGLSETETHGVLAREASRRIGRLVAWALLAVFALAVLVAGRRELTRGVVLRRAFSPARLLVAVYALAFPVWLAQRYDHDALDTFLFLAVGAAGVLAVASLGGEAMRARGASRRARLAIATLAVAAHAAVGYLALDRAGQLLSLFA
jgi:tetratricopeptide (TPR) repeat protein